ncbi:hypothetical protein PVAND_013365 [Polypedilum vanderplanki]|uniref:RNA helicase n=1 Tax=Polypedilum vanderplanki TaxID=319348 RepID=A0A9J6CPH0_POLVA|nr:hypothetical protein PVAND_013365 [Polypedilum vanderplanki]
MIKALFEYFFQKRLENKQKLEYQKRLEFEENVDRLLQNDYESDEEIEQTQVKLDFYKDINDESWEHTYNREAIKTLDKKEYRNTTRHKRYDGVVIPGQRLRETTRFIEVRMSDYLIPDRLRKSFDFKKQPQLIVNDFMSSQTHHFLIEELNEQNYKGKMRYCLYIEEIQMEICFDRYRIDRAFFENKGEYLRLKIDGASELRPSLGIGDSIQVSDLFVSKTHKQVHEGIIHRVEMDGILVKFHNDFHYTHDRKDYRIEFFFSRAPLIRQQFALDQVTSKDGLGLDFLFPKENVIHNSLILNATLSKNENILINGVESDFYNKSLNIYQKKAVINVLRAESRPLPYIIYGPPGSGKTQTVVECIEQIAKKISWSRIIVAAPSNSAANLIVQKLVNYGRFKTNEFVRFVSYNQIISDAIPENIKQFCATIDIGHEKGDLYDSDKTEEGFPKLSKMKIIKYKICISTLSNLGPLMNIRFKREHFTHVIIDEAGQSVETETMIPLSFLSNRGQVILAGDPKQLNPIINSQVAKICGFEKSLLERLSEHKFYQPIYGPNKNEFDCKFVTKLKKNYRSLPSILKVYSKLFYDDELNPEINDENSREIKLLQSIEPILWNRSSANKKCGIYFVNVNGKNMRILGSTSLFNNQEAARLFLFTCKLKRLGISMKSVGIITPYALQVKALRKIINESMPDNCDAIKVGSVEEFQGQERDIILISTVRTTRTFTSNDPSQNTAGLGFLQSGKRTNVAISRARALLIVFGKEAILSHDENWKYLIEYTKENGTYVTENVITTL